MERVGSVSFGARVKQLRKEAGLTVAQAASAAGFEIGIWQDFEDGRRGPLLAGLWPMAKALDCEPKDLLE